MCRRFVELLADLLDDLVVDQFQMVGRAAERRVRLEMDLVRSAVLDELLLVEERVALDLITLLMSGVCVYVILMTPM